MFFMIIDDKRPLKEITHHPQHSSYLSSIVHIPSSYSQNNHHMTSQYLKNNPIKPFFAFCFSIITMYQKYIQLKLYSDHVIPCVLLKIKLITNKHVLTLSHHDKRKTFRYLEFKHCKPLTQNQKQMPLHSLTVHKLF